jgi:hypothetical protein
LNPLSRLRRQLPQRGSQAFPYGVCAAMPQGGRGTGEAGGWGQSILLHHRPGSIQNHYRSWRWSPSPVTRAGSQHRWRKVCYVGYIPPLCWVGQAQTLKTAVDEAASCPLSCALYSDTAHRAASSIPPAYCCAGSLSRLRRQLPQRGSQAFPYGVCAAMPQGGRGTGEAGGWGQKRHLRKN